jgi:hypothetical protein
MAPEQLTIGADEAPRWDVPVIYVASALSHLSPSERILLRPWCEAASAAVVDATQDDDPAWSVGTHVPFTWSAPWSGDGREPHEIYSANMRYVRDAAALIVVGYRGGSLGAGQEFGWASALRIPILYLRPKGDPISRQIEGTPADTEFAEFETIEELKAAVVAFVRSRRTAIEDHPRRLRDRTMVLAPFAEAIEERWGNLSEKDRERTAANARLHPRRVEELVNDPLTLATGALNELLALTGALGVDPWRLLSGGAPELESRQVEALRTAAHEYDWEEVETLEVYLDARSEMARGGVRRLSLATVEDWVRFRDARRDRKRD